MRIPKELKEINRFHEVALPNKSVMFARLNGNLLKPGQSQYSGDTSLPNNLSKVEKIARAERINQFQLKKESIEQPTEE